MTKEYKHKEYLMPNRGYAIIGLEEPKQWNNVGQVCRAATNYDVANVFVQGMRYQRSAADTTEYWRHKPLINVDDLLTVIPRGAEIIAVDLIPGAESIYNFEHPNQAYYIFGREDGTVSKRVIERADHVIYIPTAHCLNLAMAVHTVLYDRSYKRQEYHMKMPLGKDAEQLNIVDDAVGV